jgi:hypothetical protein
LFLFHLPEDVPKAGGNIHALKVIQNTEPTIGVFVGCRSKTVNTQDNIFQRLRIQAVFRMGDIRIDDDQIVGMHRKKSDPQSETVPCR